MAWLHICKKLHMWIVEFAGDSIQHKWKATSHKHAYTRKYRFSDCRKTFFTTPSTFWAAKYYFFFTFCHKLLWNMLQLFCILFLMHFIVKFRPQNTILLLPGGGSIVSHASRESVSYTNCCEPPHPHPPPFPCDPIKERQASETAACLAINTLCGPDSNPASFTTPASQAGERRLMLILSIKHLITLLICSCALAFAPSFSSPANTLAKKAQQTADGG